jgi:hypothetical protein
MEAICSSETSVDTQRTTRRYIPEDGTLHLVLCFSCFTGTLYHRDEPILLPSIGNAFVLRCLDGIHVDGNDRRMSKMIYKQVYSYITSALLDVIRDCFVALSMFS